MKNKTYTLNTVLAVLLGIALLVCVLIRTFAPRIIMPNLDVVNMTLISLAALLVDHYLAPGAKRCYICIPVFAALSFGLLPLAAGLVTAASALGLAVTGCVIFTLCTFVYSSIQDRLSSGPAARLAPILSALGIWLAVQAFAGIGL